MIGNMRVKDVATTSPAEQLLWRQSVPSGHGTDRVTAGRDLGNNPGFVFITPRPAPTRTGEHLEPTNRLRDSILLSVHSKPKDPNQTADSQIRTLSGR